VTVSQQTKDAVLYFLTLIVGLLLAFSINGCASCAPRGELKQVPVCAKSTKLTIGKKGEDHDVIVESYACEVWMTADGLRVTGEPESPAPPGSVRKETRTEEQEPELPPAEPGTRAPSARELEL